MEGMQGSVFEGSRKREVKGFTDREGLLSLRGQRLWKVMAGEKEEGGAARDVAQSG